MVAAIGDDPRTDADMIDECSIPYFKEPACFEFPQTKQTIFQGVLQQYKDLFRGSPGLTDSTYHFIPTKGTPAKVQSRRIPIHYKLGSRTADPRHVEERNHRGKQESVYGTNSICEEEIGGNSSMR